jgi:hypothetical protein
VRRPVSPLIAALLVVPLMTACSGGGSAGAAPSPSARPTPTPCPGVSQPAQVGRWPTPVPSDLPQPPSGTKARVVQTNQLLTVVLVQTSLSLREAVIFVLREFPKKGFTIGRGDAEAGQADAPFVRGNVFGQVRLNFLGDCHTQWLVAVGAARQGTSPLLPPPSTSPNVLPPFGK